ncbi:helix-turn-helix transcriptional regulator [Bacillus sp. Gen3]|nr:helix-turn-helix transcriptional regulator [Bacillus sp. Gen3]
MSLFKMGRCLVQEILDSRGMTQQQLAKITGLNEKYLSDKINNRGPRGMTLVNAKKIAYALRCHIEDLYEWKQE